MACAGPPQPAASTLELRATQDTADWEEVRLPLSTGVSLPTYWWHPPAKSEPGTFAVLCLHGAGDVALVWAQVARRLQRLGGPVGDIISADLRGHGGAVAGERLDESLRLQRLLPDVLSLIRCLSEERLQGEGMILCGHSLGGALAARAAAEARRATPPLAVRAVVLLETVEGTAAETLPRSVAWMQARPRSFDSLQDAIAWSLSSGMLTDPEAARQNVPPRLHHNVQAGKESWSWITDVAEAVACWPQWFDGVSSLFVSLPMPKLLIVGSVDRMDAALEAAHMQGRFRLAVIPHPGHYIHEDRPDEVAEAITHFLRQLQRQEKAFAKLTVSAHCGPSYVKRQRADAHG